MKYLKSLNWSGYLIVILLVGIAAFANEGTIIDNNINWVNWFVLLLIGAFLGLFILIGGRKTE